MADLDDRLSVLTRALGEGGPPPLAELGGRVERRRRRRRAATVLGGVAAAAALIAGAVALTGGAPGETTVRMAAPGGRPGDASVSSPAAAPGGPIVVDVFTVADQRWELAAVTPERDRICLFLRTPGREDQRADCFGAPSRAIEAVAVDLGSFTYVTGVLAKGVVALAFRPEEVQSRIHDPGLPVNVFGAPVRPAIDRLSALVTMRDGTQQSLAVSMPAHGRTDAVDGQPAPPTSTPARPTTTVAVTTPPPSGPTDPAPTTTAVPPTRPAPTTTAPPSTGRPERVEVVPGATNLRKHVFQSAVPFGAQSLLVTFWDGVAPCSVLGRVDLVETAASVTVTLWTGTGPGAEGQACIAIAQQKETVVALAAPLGGRPVIDGAG